MSGSGKYEPSAKGDEPVSQRPVFIVIAAHNEEDYIGRCLEALINQDDRAGLVHVVVAANACTDQTVAIVAGCEERFVQRGWKTELLEIESPGKLNALNMADHYIDQESSASPRIYLDADVICDPNIVGQLREVLSNSKATYATGKLQMSRAESWVTRHYARVWIRLPFMQEGAAGAGLFAVNAAGRSRWGAFPDIISDDTFVRLQFSPAERKEVPALYQWPMVEGLSNLVRVRKRQDLGVEEVFRLYPELNKNNSKSPMTAPALFGLLLKEPIGFVIYAFVHLLVRIQPANTEWTRGR